MPDISPLIRLFVSSTFTDFTVERDVLQRMVFPRLRQLCEAQGCRFQPIDLRWGVSEEAGNEKRTLTICFEEIRRCQQLSPDLNFLILLGDRYGSCFLPAIIPSTQVVRLLPHLNTEEQDIFRDAYREDLNALPPEYVLLPNIAGGRNDERLRMALGRAARAAGFSPEEVLPFVASATHLEIQRGLLAAWADPAAVVCALRSFTSTPAGNDASGYVEQDSARGAQVESLKHAVEERLEGRLQRYAVPWGANGPVLDREALARQLREVLEPRVREALARRQAAAQTRDPVGEANSQFSTARASVLVGREDALATVARYLSNQLPFPLVVTGGSGVGKSSLLARAVEDATRMHPNAVMVARYIGVTPGTSSLADLLTGLRREIDERYGRPEPEPLGDLSQLVAAVATQLETQPAPADRPLFVVIDALDQLGMQRQRVDWLPSALAPNVHVVVSILSGRPELENLNALLPEGRGLRLEPLTRAEGATVLHTWLAAEQQRLTPIQEAAVLDGFAPTSASRGMPLYLRLAFEQARTWRSFDPVKPLPPTIPALIQAYFEQLEEPGRHGQEMVAYALGYVAAAKHGLAEDELLDLLPRAEIVREGIRRVSPNSPPIDAQQPLPMVLWARLAADLDRYLTEREADGARLVAFYHQQVREEAEQRYLSGIDRAARHADLAAYFGEQRYRLGEGDAGRWNRRKLAEIAYHEAEVGPDARQALVTTLTDVRFLEGNLTVDGVAATLDDLALARSDTDVAKIATAVRAGAVVLANAPSELLNQIIGRVGQVMRLHGLPERTIPSLRLRSHSLSADAALIHVLQGHEEDVLDCALSADGRLALSASVDKTVRVWDTNSGQTLRILEGHSAPVSGCALSADGRLALSASADRTLRVWDTSSGNTLHILEGHAGTVDACALSADGQLALSTSRGEPLRLWDTASGETLRTLEGHTDLVTSCALSADGRLALSTSLDHTLRVWDTATGQALRISECNMDGYCALSADGGLALSGSTYGTLRVWDTASGETVRELEGHASTVSECALSADGRIALSASEWDGTVRVWDTATGQTFYVLEGHSLMVRGCALSADGQFGLSAADNSALRLWDISGVQPSRLLKSHSESVLDCALSADGRLALSASFDKTLRVWDTSSGRMLHILEGHSGMVAGCALSADGRLAFSASADRTLRLWDTTSGQALRILEGHTLGIGDCALSADGRLGLSGALDQTVRIWDTTSGQPLHILKGHADDVASCALSADGHTGLSASDLPGQMLLVWDTISGEPVRIIDENTGWVQNCALSADGQFALSASFDQTLRLWDTTSGTLLRVIVGHTEPVTACALSADARLALSASLDKTLRLWDTVTSQEITRWTHDVDLRSCALSADGRLAMAGDSFGGVHFLDVVGMSTISASPGATDPPVSWLAALGSDSQGAAEPHSAQETQSAKPTRKPGLLQRFFGGRRAPQ